MASGMDWAALISGLAGAGVTAYAASRNSRNNREIASDEMAADAASNTQKVALEESLADPFRHQLSQAQNLARLDMLRQFNQGGRRVTPPANVAPYTGQVRHGYQASPSMQQSIDALEQSVRSGQTAPTMTNPANYGRTSAVNINAANGQPGGPGVGAPLGGSNTLQDPRSYLPGQEARRNEGAGGVMNEALKDAARGSVGGPWGAAGGFVGGAIKGAFTKNAKTAMTDLTVDQARAVLQQVYETELGRSASPEEVDAQLRGQGWNGQSRWVGEDGLTSVIRQIQSSVEARNRRSGVAA